jgi:hypothetical protein
MLSRPPPDTASRRKIQARDGVPQHNQARDIQPAVPVSGQPAQASSLGLRVGSGAGVVMGAVARSESR